MQFLMAALWQAPNLRKLDIYHFQDHIVLPQGLTALKVCLPNSYVDWSGILELPDSYLDWSEDMRGVGRQENIMHSLHASLRGMHKLQSLEVHIEDPNNKQEGLRLLELPAMSSLRHLIARQSNVSVAHLALSPVSIVHLHMLAAPRYDMPYSANLKAANLVSVSLGLAGVSCLQELFCRSPRLETLEVQTFYNSLSQIAADESEQVNAPCPLKSFTIHELYIPSLTCHIHVVSCCPTPHISMPQGCCDMKLHWTCTSYK